MEQIWKFTQDFFGANIISILALSLAWIPLYWIKRLLDFVAPLLFLKIPVAFNIYAWRRKSGINDFVNKITKSTNPDNSLVQESALMVSDEINKWELKLNRLPYRFPILLLLNEQSAINQIRKIYKTDLAKLETDLAFIESCSENPKIKFSAFVTINEHNQIPDDTAIRYVLRKLKSMESEILISVLYSLTPRINNADQISTIKRILGNKDFQQIYKNDIMKAVSRLELVVDSNKFSRKV